MIRCSCCYRTYCCTRRSTYSKGNVTHISRPPVMPPDRNGCLGWYLVSTAVVESPAMLFGFRAMFWVSASLFCGGILAEPLGGLSIWFWRRDFFERFWHSSRTDINSTAGLAPSEERAQQSINRDAQAGGSTGERLNTQCLLLSTSFYVQKIFSVRVLQSIFCRKCLQSSSNVPRKREVKRRQRFGVGFANCTFSQELHAQCKEAAAHSVQARAHSRIFAFSHARCHQCLRRPPPPRASGNNIAAQRENMPVEKRAYLLYS